MTLDIRPIYRHNFQYDKVRSDMSGGKILIHSCTRCDMVHAQFREGKKPDQLIEDVNIINDSLKFELCQESPIIVNSEPDEIFCV